MIKKTVDLAWGLDVFASYDLSTKTVDNLVDNVGDCD